MEEESTSFMGWSVKKGGFHVLEKPSFNEKKQI